MKYEIYGQPAKKHTNGGGLVAITAYVADTAYVGPDAKVYGNAGVYGNARVSGNAEVYGDARVYGNAEVSGDAQVYGDAWVYGNAEVYGDAWVSGDAMVSNPQDLATLTINGINITITKQNAVIGCQCLSHKEWLYMTGEQALEFGQEYGDLFDFYRPALLQIMNPFMESNNANK